MTRVVVSPFHGENNVMLTEGMTLDSAYERKLLDIAAKDPASAANPGERAAIDDAQHKLAKCVLVVNAPTPAAPAPAPSPAPAPVPASQKSIE